MYEDFYRPDTNYYKPKTIHPFYKNVLSTKALSQEWSDRSSQNGFEMTRGNIFIIGDNKEITIGIGKKWRGIVLEKGILCRNRDILVNSYCNVQDSKMKKITDKRIIVHVGSICFIGSIEPQEGCEYYLPYSHRVGSITININYIYGCVIFHTMPDNLFHMACNYNRKGKLVGVCSRFVYPRSLLGVNERRGYDYGVPVYISYYDKEGKSMTPREYDECVFIIVQQVTRLPNVLCSLLGYLL